MEKDQMVLHNPVLVNDSLPRAIYPVVDERAGLDNVQYSRINQFKQIHGTEDFVWSTIFEIGTGTGAGS